MITQKFIQRFWGRVDVKGSDDCWLWTGSKNRKGYGQVSLNGKVQRTHRVSWVLSFGEIPSGLCVCHKCDVPSCVNPSHLFLGTVAENTRDMISKGRARYSPDCRPPIRTGEKNGGSKLTWAIVRSMRSEYVDGSTISTLSEKYGVTYQNVRLVLMGRTWKDRDGTSCVYIRDDSPWSGEKNSAAKLTRSQVDEIRASKMRGDSVKSIAAKYGTGANNIRRILSGERWK